MLRKTALFISTLLLACHAYALDWVAINSNHPAEPIISTSINQNGNILTHVSIPGYHTKTINHNGISLMLTGGVNETEAGNPEMQHLTISLQIADRGNTRAILTDAQYYEYTDINIAPSKGDPQFSDKPDYDKTRYNDQIYKNNHFYPAQLIELNEPYIWCDVRGQAIQVYPFSYNPVTKVLRVYYSISFEIYNTNSPGQNELTRYSADYGTLKGMRASASEHFANYSNNNRNIAIDEPGNMLILAQASFVETLQPFVEWKTRTGLSCEIVDVANLGNAQSIKQFVSEYYYNHGLTYLLLAGDAGQIPSMQAENGASDNMYGYISGNDHYPEILVGRFPAETTAQLANMVQRSLNYEMNPSLEAKFDHFLGIASELGPGDDGEADYEHIRNIGEIMLESTYTNFSEMYDGSQQGADANGNPTKIQVENAINAGQGAIMYIGHGTKNEWTTSGFSYTDALKLKNTETQPFIWSSGCSNGDFVSSSCLAEAWLRAEYNNQPAGAVAVMMSTCTQSWYPPMEAQDEIALILSGKKASVTTRTFAGVSMSACVRMNDKYGIGGYRVTDTWTIFGDPSVQLRTSPAQNISTHHVPETGADTRVFVVKLPDSEALACITQQNTLLGAARVTDGIANISISAPITTDNITLTVTEFNHLPYTALIPVTRMPAAATQSIPENNNRKISVYTPFSWETGTGMNPDYYELFITEGNNPEWTENGIIVPGKTFSPSQKLSYNTTYTWKVVSHNQYGETESKNFTFTTINPPDEDFESQGFPRSNWINDSRETWFIDAANAFEGHFSLRSGAIGNSDTSRLSFECYTPSCDYLGFRKMISSQAGADKLQLVIDGQIVAEWSGECNWTEETFPVEPGNHLITWNYIKDGSLQQGADAAWIDNIYLPVNDAAALITTDITTCNNETIYPSAIASNYTKVRWTTAGNGLFEDETSLNPVYYPSTQERLNGHILLNVMAYSNNFCDPVCSFVSISLESLPELPIVYDTSIYAGEKLIISLPDNNASSFKVTPEGLVDRDLIIDGSNLQPGANEFTISSENEAGCTAEHKFTVTLLNGSRPISGEELLIYPNPAKENINIASIGTIEENFNLQVLDLAGRVVASQGKTGADLGQIDVSSVGEGVYFVRIQNGTRFMTGRFVKVL